MGLKYRILILILVVIAVVDCGGHHHHPRHARHGHIRKAKWSSRTYVVKSGDTLSRIADNYRISYQYLAEYNNLEDPSRIRVGQKIHIPSRAEKPSRRPGHAKDDVIRTERDKFVWPVEGRLGGLFGQRGDTHHDGIDIVVPKNTPIRAAADGEVVYEGVLSGYGNLVIVRHKDDYYTAYAHNARNSVREGDKVRRGKTTIGKVGQTGRASTPHLHFEVRYHELPRNPLFYLPKR